MIPMHDMTDIDNPVVDPAQLATALRDGLAAGITPAEAHADAEVLAGALRRESS